MTKPTAYFLGIASFDDESFPGVEFARVQTYSHPVLGADRVRTSRVLHKFPDGSFETMNTIYKPIKNEIQDTPRD